MGEKGREIKRWTERSTKREINSNTETKKTHAERMTEGAKECSRENETADE